MERGKIDVPCKAMSFLIALQEKAGCHKEGGLFCLSHRLLIVSRDLQSKGLQIGVFLRKSSADADSTLTMQDTRVASSD